MIIKKSIYYLIFLYVLTIPLNRGLDLPVIGEKIQLPELLFLILGVASVPLFFKFNYKNFRFISIDWGLLFYFLAVVFSYCFRPTRASLLDVAGLIYLISLYAIINLFFLNHKTEKIKFILTQFSATSLFLLSVIGISGFLLLFLGFKTSLATFYENYPFFGNVYRIRALTQEPVMMASILSVFILAVLAGYNLTEFTLKEKIWLKISIILSFVALALTITKSSVITVAAAFAIYSIQRNKFKKLKPFIWFSALIALLFFTHFVLIKKEKFDNNFTYRGLVDKPTLSFGNFYLVETDYGTLKEVTIITGKRFWLTGIGSGNFSDYVPTLKKEGLYPTKFTNLDPISTYFGAFAELGLFGLLVLLYLYFQIYKTLIYLKEKNPEDAIWLSSIVPIFGFMACEGFVTDTMNFRHYWWILSCIALYERIYKKTLKINKI